ncbi:transcriptional regulator, LacI family [Oceanithermus profundus DSM 14977]|uniref:Transcriptional regulator, LacI family n=1 Tax=Oceanithermus profundus (strain DSM 14977 / NBRC 100410 / VKM B-2274 / 506) TaxID=670487 RepID=E4U9Q5_OCEP5|nr:transcriptional regulator, LacI family [Oceanithermus profundus DSM 14977]
MRRRVTIYEVADAAGVSVATVSRALNGGRVAPSTRERVLQVAGRLGFSPSPAARVLATGKSRAIGVVIPDATGPLYGRMLRGIGLELAQAGYTYLVESSERDPGREGQVLRDLSARDVEALVLIGSGLGPQALAAMQGELPALVLVEREGAELAAPMVTIDNESAAERATRYLIEHGHERIAHIAGPRRAGRERLAGWRRALAAAGLAPGPVADGGFTEAGGYRAAEALIGQGGFSAVFVASDRMALGAYRAFREAGLRVGEDVSVVGFDGLEFGAYLDPPLTTLRQPAQQLGQAAARAALAVTRGERPENVVLSCELVPRASVMEYGGGL